MSANGLSIGMDLNAVIILQDGRIFRPGKMMKFHPKQLTNVEKREALDGDIANVTFYTGWDIEFEYDRDSSAADDYFADLEANYHAGIHNSYVDIQTTESNPDGSVSQFLYERVALIYDDAGTREAKKVTSMKLKGHASKRMNLV